jgi:hypothetical protein
LGLDAKQECIPVSFSSKSKTSPHGRAHVAVAQEFLDGSDVAIVLEQVRGKE